MLQPALLSTLSSYAPTQTLLCTMETVPLTLIINLAYGKTMKAPIIFQQKFNVLAINYSIKTS